MTVTTDVTRTGDTVTGRFTVKNLPSRDEVAKPAYAVAGLADLALEQVKDVPSDVQARLQTVPAQVRDLPQTVKARLDERAEQASDLYGRLATRGERLVTAIRRQPATQAAVAEAKDAISKAEMSATSAKKAAKAGEKAVEDASHKVG